MQRRATCKFEQVCPSFAESEAEVSSARILPGYASQLAGTRNAPVSLTFYYLRYILFAIYEMNTKKIVEIFEALK